MKAKNEKIGSNVIYRKKVFEDVETYCAIDTNIRYGIGNRAFSLKVEEIPYLATHTYKTYKSVTFYPHFSPPGFDFAPVLNCTDGWEKISEKEYRTVLSQIMRDIR